MIAHTSRAVPINVEIKAMLVSKVRNGLPDGDGITVPPAHVVDASLWPHRIPEHRIRHIRRINVVPYLIATPSVDRVLLTGYRLLRQPSEKPLHLHRRPATAGETPTTKAYRLKPVATAELLHHEIRRR